MFLRAVKAPNGRHQYLRLVESVREGKKVKQRVVAHLGRKDQLAPHLDALIRLLQDETQAPRWVPIQDVSAPRASTWGPILVARHLFHHLSLGTILDGERPLRRHGQLLSERIFPLLANRLTRPGSEHALAQWLEDFFVCNAEGSRWMPVWKQSRRVKVDFEQLRLWYQSLDDLRAQKARIEKQVFLELRNLFSLRPDLVFYDITSTFFEGAGPESAIPVGASGIRGRPWHDDDRHREATARATAGVLAGTATPQSQGHVRLYPTGRDAPRLATVSGGNHGGGKGGGAADASDGGCGERSRGAGVGRA